MKSSRFILFFIGISLLLHLSLVIISFKPEEVVIIPEQKKLIPVDLAMKHHNKPEAVSKHEPPSPEPEESTVRPNAAPVPVPTKEPKPQIVPSTLPLTDPSPSTLSGAERSSDENTSIPANTTSTNQNGPQNENPFEGLLQRLNQYKKSTYPLSARKKGFQGTVLIKLILDKDGYIISSEIIKKSSHSSLNSAALKLIDKIMETPYPHNLGKQVSLRLPISYKLD